MFSNVKYVRAGHSWDSPIMYVIIRNRTEHGCWKVEVFPCDLQGCPVSDAVDWNIFPSWWDSCQYIRKKYKEYDTFVNAHL